MGWTLYCCLLLLCRVIVKLAHRCIKLAQHHRIARSAIERAIGQIGYPLDAETGGKAAESQCGDMPVGVAARPVQQVDMMGGAFDERPAQFCDQGRVAAHGGGQCRVQCS